MPVAGWNQVDRALNGPSYPLVTTALWLEIEMALYERANVRTALDGTWWEAMPPIVPATWPAVKARDPIDAFKAFRDYAYAQAIAQPLAFYEPTPPNELNAPDPFYMANVGDPTPGGYVSLFLHAGLAQDFWTIAGPNDGLVWAPFWTDFELVLNKLVFYYMPYGPNVVSGGVDGGDTLDVEFDVFDTYPAVWTGVNLTGCHFTTRFVYYFQYTFGGTGNPALAVKITNCYDITTGEPRQNSDPPFATWVAIDSVNLINDGFPHWVKMVWGGNLLTACDQHAGINYRAAIRFDFTAGAVGEFVTIEAAQAYLDFDWQYHG